MNLPRSEYPRPQFVRSDWLCLNGEWDFEIDTADSGKERGLVTSPYSQRIQVPFCPESKLSGIENTDFLEAVWYRKTVTLPSEWDGRTAWLHFQAVDYDATVWVQGREMARHRGGFSPFSVELTGIAAGETVEIVVRARDPHEPSQPRGKQSQLYGNYGCWYTRTTGIWQTVWLEPLPHFHLKRPRITPDVSRRAFRIDQPLSASRAGLRYRAILRDSGGEIAREEIPADADFSASVELSVPIECQRLWSIKDPHLYELELELLDEDGMVLDRVESYAGLRSVRIDGKAVLLNGKPVFQRLVLDQGYYPDGLMTAPSDEALVRDIELGQEAGFNGARLHQKVFEERFLYHADRLGYLVWGEFGDWGCNRSAIPHSDNQQPGASFITEWLEILERDYSHPSIIGWCPLNETLQNIDDRIRVLDVVTRGMFLATKAMDLTRPVLDTSGYAHRVPETDIYDCHDYEQKVDVFQKNHAGLAEDKPFSNNPDWSIPYRGQPFFVSEFGGIWWNPKTKEGEDSWGYGERPKTLEELYTRFEGLCGALLDDPRMFGYCYTQLTDVFQEQNGIYGFDRSIKFDMEKIQSAQIRTAAIERGL